MKGDTYIYDGHLYLTGDIRKGTFNATSGAWTEQKNLNNYCVMKGVKNLHCLDINNTTELLELHYDNLDFELGPSRSCRAGAGLRLTQRLFLYNNLFASLARKSNPGARAGTGCSRQGHCAPALPEWDAAGTLVYRAPSGRGRRRSVTGHLGDNLSAVRAHRRMLPLRVRARASKLRGARGHNAERKGAMRGG